MSGYRSAIKSLYRTKRLALPAEYADDMRTFYSGLKRIEATTIQSGGAKESGKIPLKYSDYQDLCMQSLTLNDKGFSHLFLTTQWNLMCRSKSVETLDTDHFSNQDDSVGLVLYKTKTNQEGRKAKDPTHVFANPFSPETGIVPRMQSRPKTRSSLRWFKPENPIWEDNDQNA